MERNHLTPHELIDIIARYHPRVDLRDYGVDREDEPAFITYVESTPEYQAREAKLFQEHAESAWVTFVTARLMPLLPALDLRVNTSPSSISHELLAYHVEGEALADGDLESALVVRVSMLAPVYEIHETGSYIVRSAVPGTPVRYRDHYHTHDIADRFQPVAEVIAREIEKEFGYQRLEAEVLDILLLNLAVPDYLVNEPTVGDALFGRH